MISLLAISIRRGWGIPLLPIFLGLEILALVSGGGEWSLEWGWTTSWMNGILVLLGPTVAAAAAAESVYVKRRSGARLIRAPWFRAFGAHAARAVALGFWGCLAHGVGLVVAWGLAALRHDGLGMLELPPIGATLVLIVAWACLGSLAGWAFPWAATPVAVGVLGYIVPALQLIKPSLFVLGGSTAPMAGLRTRPVVVVALSLTWLAVAVAALVIATLVHRWRPGFALGSAAVVSTLAVLLLGHWAARTEPDLMARNAAAARVCVTSTVTVCAYEEHSGILAAAVREVDTVSRRLGLVYGPLPADTTIQLGGIRAPGTIVIGMLTRPPWITTEMAALDLFTGQMGCRQSDEWAQGEALALVQYAIPMGFPGNPGHAVPRSVPEAQDRYAQLRRVCHEGA